MTDYERYGDYQPSERGSAGLALTFLLIGLGAGALVALLFAPRSGRQLRRELRRKYEDTLETLQEQRENWREKGSEWAESAREKVEPIRRAVRNQ